MPKRLIAIFILVCFVFSCVELSSPTVCYAIDPSDIIALIKKLMDLLAALGLAAKEKTQKKTLAEMTALVAALGVFESNQKTALERWGTRVSHNIEFLEDMKYNASLVDLTDNRTLATTRLKEVLKIYGETSGVVGRLADLDSAVASHFFPDNRTYWKRNYAQEYRDLNMAMDNMVTQVLSNDLKINIEDISKSKDILNKLGGGDLSSLLSGTGRNAIIKSGNILLSFMGTEVIKMRSLIMDQMNSYLDYYRALQTEEIAFTMVMSDDIGTWSESKKEKKDEKEKKKPLKNYVGMLKADF